MTQAFVPYRPRPLRSLGRHDIGGYRLKQYAITLADDVPFDAAAFADGLRLACGQLPSPAVTGERPGVGFAILHQARTLNYLILCWWDRENELPTRVFVQDGGAWRPAAGGESFCVWDLHVVGWERDAYVHTVLAGGDAEAYLARTANGYA
jgi:hypothetical protein